MNLHARARTHTHRPAECYRSVILVAAVIRMVLDDDDDDYYYYYYYVLIQATQRVQLYNRERRLFNNKHTQLLPSSYRITYLRNEILLLLYIKKT
jgi:hypothetical protein